MVKKANMERVYTKLAKDKKMYIESSRKNNQYSVYETRPARTQTRLRVKWRSEVGAESSLAFPFLSIYDQFLSPFEEEKTYITQ